MLSKNLNHKRVTVVINSNTDDLLIASAKKSGRTKKEELKIRIAHSLKNFEVIEDNYWNLISV